MKEINDIIHRVNVTTKIITKFAFQCKLAVVSISSHKVTFVINNVNMFPMNNVVSLIDVGFEYEPISLQKCHVANFYVSKTHTISIDNKATIKNNMDFTFIDMNYWDIANRIQMYMLHTSTKLISEDVMSIDTVSQIILYNPNSQINVVCSAFVSKRLQYDFSMITVVTNHGIVNNNV